MTTNRILGASLALVLCAGCRRDRPQPVRAAAPPPVPARSLTAADSTRMRAALASRLDSVAQRFARAEVLRPSEVAGLRQDRNAEQLASAMALGTRLHGGAAEAERLRSQHRLVPLGDSTAYWILREMDHSIPLVTPDARAMLLLLGRRFHARLDSLGVPRYRMKITSALRTADDQADLRRTNSYAARTMSAHEFGTTVDVSHERFAAPADTGAAAWPAARERIDSIGARHAKVLQAELGRALAELRDQGVLFVMMENQQPVYHMTVARRLRAPE
jgi:hypothetical protein